MIGIKTWYSFVTESLTDQREIDQLSELFEDYKTKIGDIHYGKVAHKNDGIHQWTFIHGEVKDLGKMQEFFMNIGIPHVKLATIGNNAALMIMPVCKHIGRGSFQN
jgi:hypothetical protein